MTWSQLLAGTPVAFFILLAVLFAVAVLRRDEATERAAAWGVSASFCAGFAAFAATAAFTSRRPGDQLLSGRIWATCVGVASLIVTAIAVNLVLIDEPVGAWMLVPPAIVTSLIGFLDVLIRTVGVPRVETPDQEPADPAPAHEEHQEHQESEGLEAREASSAETGVVPEQTDPSAAELTGPPALLHATAAARLAQSGLAVALDQSFWRATERSLDPHGLEQGGVALTVRLDGVMVIFGAVFPRQSEATSIRCAFPVAEIDRVRQAISSVADEFGCTITISWVHTHPGLTVFLSGTDQATSSAWRALDRDFTPIVIDISKPRLAEQIGVFDSAGKIEAMGVLPDLTDPRAVGRLENSLRAAYRREGLADPLILLPAAAQLERV